MIRCASCIRGEIDNNDIKDRTRYLVKDPDSGKIELSGYLCDDHIDMYLAEGYALHSGGRQ